ncbi:response regulator [Dactylosporangium fulvum]|uniref:Response regulator n=1 Tax=Dactylosporangium fulvum TaxID=53359 RepID=A0ABY5VP70_9ACTN|nr:response regulator [Dactylosporangium fulvum]UWP78889.1 response regulator [Dactylosporangium fulvum]
MTTVMLVDDSATILMSLKSILTKAGYAVETAGHGREALDKLGGGLRPNLIISDVNMPHMDGISFTREARKSAGMRFTPILMLTTESEQTKRAEAKTAGATGWLVKPVAPDQLLGVIKQVLPGA